MRHPYFTTPKGDQHEAGREQRTAEVFRFLNRKTVQGRRVLRIERS